MTAYRRKADCTPGEWAHRLVLNRAKYARHKTKNPTYQRDWKRRKRASDPSFNARINAARCVPEARIKDLWYQARFRARRRGMLFTITLEDLLPAPTHCRVFPWVKLDYHSGDKNAFNRASIDRIDNAKGYVAGNVCVISRRANTIKCDATLEELKRIVDYAASEAGLV